MVDPIESYPAATHALVVEHMTFDFGGLSSGEDDEPQPTVQMNVFARNFADPTQHVTFALLFRAGLLTALAERVPELEAQAVEVLARQREADGG